MLSLLEQSFLFHSKPELPHDKLVELFTALYDQAPATPVVDEMISPWQEKRQASVYFTHDVDWLDLQHPYSLFKYIQQLVDPEKNWFSIKQLIHKDYLLKNIEALVAFEQQKGMNSLFLLGAGDQATTLGRHDIRYTRKSTLFSELVSFLHHNNNPVGLHSAYSSSTGKSFQEQKNTLEKAAHKTVTYHRSHFLHYDKTTIFSHLEQAGITTDMSIGYAGKVGFKAGTCQAFNGIDLQNGKVSTVKEVPLMLMDNVFFRQDAKEVMEQVKRCLDHVIQHSGCVSVLFHPENMALKPELWEHYDQLISLCIERGININPALN